jgi:asparagine synthase (glutamine-hydrolysing)
MPWELPTVLDPDLVREGWAELHALSRLAETTRGLRGIRTQVSALETTWYMRNQLLRDTDWASMSHSLEVRVPFVDWTLWSVVAPMVAAAPTRVNKARMATVAAPALAPSLLARPKSGFSIPVRDWLDQGDRARATDRGLRGWARAVYERYIGG